MNKKNQKKLNKRLLKNRFVIKKLFLPENKYVIESSKALREISRVGEKLGRSFRSMSKTCEKIKEAVNLYKEVSN